MNAHLIQPTGSAYFLAPETQTVERHTLSVLIVRSAESDTVVGENRSAAYVCT